jgi:hypothetical protein
MEAGKKVCYAFTRASRSEGAGNRQNVILTVTHRQQGRDQVALRAGYTYARNAEVEVKVGSNELPFYTAQDNAFAREGAKAVAAFRNGAPPWPPALGRRAAVPPPIASPSPASALPMKRSAVSARPPAVAEPGGLSDLEHP